MGCTTPAVTHVNTLLESILYGIARDLTPDERQLDAELQRGLRLIEELHGGPAWMFSVKEAVPHGSHRRRTAIVGRSDVDFLVML